MVEGRLVGVGVGAGRGVFVGVRMYLGLIYFHGSRRGEDFEFRFVCNM